MDLGTAIETDASGLHPCEEQLLTITAGGGGENVACQSLAEVAAKVEVFENEGVVLGDLLAVADVGRLCLPIHHYFEIHDLPRLVKSHLLRPHVILLPRTQLLKFLLLILAHLKLERLANEVEQARTHLSGLLLRTTTTRLLLLTRLGPLLDRVHLVGDGDCVGLVD